jgi:hypothetical protein
MFISNNFLVLVFYIAEILAIDLNWGMVLHISSFVWYLGLDE